ncbi:MAG: DUF1566 domain-containing protein [Pseudomonadota bacterium]
MKKIRASTFGFIMLMLTAVVWAAPVPDTGQSKCYNNTNEIPCPSPGQPFFGQDASYRINPMSYTKLDGSGNALTDSAESWVMVRDNVTGLIWEVKTTDGTLHDKDRTFAWSGSQNNDTDTKYFIDAMNIAQFCGYSDWRMPTIKELGTITDYNIIGSEPAINTKYFTNTQASFYWSATADTYVTDSAWGIDFYNGYDNYRNKLSYKYALAVRSGQQSGGYMEDNGDGTVTDTFTGLMWQQSGSFSTQTWEEALSYCAMLNLGNYTDWRLPTKKEVRSLVDFSRYDPSINITYFIETFSNFYWSSTTNSHITDFAWGVNFHDGYDGYGKKSDYYFVRAVRERQAPPPTGCATTIDKNLLLQIPYLTYNNPVFGFTSFWVDFVYEFNPTVILFKLTNATIINNPIIAILCSETTLSGDFKIHISDVLLPDGSTHLWVDLEYSPAFSIGENAYFIVTNYGVVYNRQDFRTVIDKVR